VPVWHDIFTTRPPHQCGIWARRSIFDTPSLFGIWDETSGSLTCGPGAWQLHDFDLWTWRPLDGPLPPWPAPGTATGWQDPWRTPPRDGQAVWLRRLGPNTAALTAVWDLSRLGFQPACSANLIPWQQVYHWKPH